MNRSFDRRKSLQELERSDWGEPEFKSHLVTTCHKLRRKPLKDFTVEDLRIMIGQNIGLIYLVPLAIDVLEQDPLARGDYYPGDLMKSVLSIESTFWKEHPELWHDMSSIVLNVRTIFDTLKDNILPAVSIFEDAHPYK